MSEIRSPSAGRPTSQGVCPPLPAPYRLVGRGGGGWRACGGGEEAGKWYFFLKQNFRYKSKSAVRTLTRTEKLRNEWAQMQVVKWCVCVFVGRGCRICDSLCRSLNLSSLIQVKAKWSPNIYLFIWNKLYIPFIFISPSWKRVCRRYKDLFRNAASKSAKLYNAVTHKRYHIFSEFSVRIPVQVCVLETMHFVNTVKVKKKFFRKSESTIISHWCAFKIKK